MKTNQWFRLLLIISTLILCVSELAAYENYKFLTEIDTVKVPYASRLAIEDYTLYVYGDSLLKVYSANNISHPKLVTEFKTNEDLNSIEPVPPYDMIVIGPMELALQENDDTNKTGKIIHVQTFNGTNSARQGSTLYIADADTGLQIVELGHGSIGRVISYFHDYLGLKALDVKWPLIYALNKFGLVVIDASDLSAPVAKGSNYQILDARCIAVKDTFALIGTKNSVIVMSIKNPDKPYIVTQAAYPFPVQSIRIRGTSAFVCLGKGGLRVLDVSYPKRPMESNSYRGKDRIFDVAFSDDYVYVADGRGGIRVLLYH
ncbi:MAG TPA: hypothetical protein PLE74_06155 [Candidatus Cloacimonadota bacterium]|nr:hypothetical protein [Candidatus Cloacimonadota bacterium]HPT71846.1 hypothetical protein [Candidatus Cloacimonadota bacterium]